MPKEKKFDLSEIRVESFVTSLSVEEKDKVKGGYPVPGTGDGCTSSICTYTYCTIPDYLCCP
jgi:hypothetical protein